MSTTTTQPIDFKSIEKTHNALFDTWFPITAIPSEIRSEIAKIASKVRSNMWTQISANPAQPSPFLQLLAGMTFPANLPFHEFLARSSNSTVKVFLAVGYGGMAEKDRISLFSFFFGSTCAEATKVAMVLREAYLAGIWSFDLAYPLTQIPHQEVFIQDAAIYSKSHAPQIPESRLRYDPQSKTIQHIEGPIDYLIIGSGPGGATVAHEMWKAGKRVVLIEKGPFVVWGSMDTRSYFRLMFQQDQATTQDNGVILRSGEVVGGGTTVNVDLAFSPLEATIQARINEWRRQGLIDDQAYSPLSLACAYQWVREKLETRQVTECEINRGNRVLWDGANCFGVDPSLYQLNRFAPELSPSPVTDKLDAARQLLLCALESKENPLSLISDAEVNEIVLRDIAGEVNAQGVSLTMREPWKEHGNTVLDPCNLKIPVGTTVSINATSIVLSAGSIGSPALLLKTAEKYSSKFSNARIGKGLILHPSLPIIGVFEEPVNPLKGLDSSTFLDAFGVDPGFIFESMTGLPSYGAVLVPGDGAQVYQNIKHFNCSTGFGVLLVDTPSDSNCVTLQDGKVVVKYSLGEKDKQRFRTGVAIAVRIMFLAGAKRVIIPSNENFLEAKEFDPMKGVYLTDISQADLVEKHLHFVPNRTILVSAHVQATNKIGPACSTSVISTNQRVWNTVTGKEVPNLYVMDSSIFPTSVGANPMQSIYTFAKIFSERLLGGVDYEPVTALR